MWEVVFHPDAETEINGLPPRERVAILHAAEKLQALGPTLPFPHQSAVRGAGDLRELRPRAGRSRWRAFYRRIGDVFVIAAIGSEYEVDRRGFEVAAESASARLQNIETQGGSP